MGAARRLAGLPRGSDAGRWLEHGLAPEICLARVELPAAWAVNSSVRDALARRRSPGLDLFRTATTGVRPVSGFVHRPGPGKPPLLHALAALRTER